jgi:hypothetical protein
MQFVTWGGGETLNAKCSEQYVQTFQQNAPKLSALKRFLQDIERQVDTTNERIHASCESCLKCGVTPRTSNVVCVHSYYTHCDLECWLGRFRGMRSVTGTNCEDQPTEEVKGFQEVGGTTFHYCRQNSSLPGLAELQEY